MLVSVGGLHQKIGSDSTHSVGLMSPFSNFGGGSETVPARMLPNLDDEPSSFQFDVVDTNDGPVTEVSTPKKLRRSRRHTSNPTETPSPPPRHRSFLRSRETSAAAVVAAAVASTARQRLTVSLTALLAGISDIAING